MSPSFYALDGLANGGVCRTVDTMGQIFSGPNVRRSRACIGTLKREL
jgi:hypothetical protein